MEELTYLLNKIEDSYPDFVAAMLHYAAKKDSRNEVLLSYLKKNPHATSSDIIRFVSEQEDFSEDASYPKVV